MNIITQTTTKLEKVKAKAREQIVASEKSQAQHQHYMQLPCMRTLECGGAGTQAALSRQFRVVAWNAERCLDVIGSAALLASLNPDIILLSEMDNGMARTGQKHTTKKLAKALGMYYLYGVEFLELDLGSDVERQIADDEVNKKGFHGNAVLTKMPLEKAAMLRLDDHGHWFSGQNVGGSFGQPRVGGRMALIADVVTADGQLLTVVSTHLESNADTTYRDKQLFDIMVTAEAFNRGSCPVIIGGDLNTGNHLAKGLDHRAETLFETAELQGFHWNANAEGNTTRPSRLTLRPDRSMKLDWFLAKHINSHHVEIVPAVDKDNTPLSDHELIVADWKL